VIIDVLGEFVIFYCVLLFCFFSYCWSLVCQSLFLFSHKRFPFTYCSILSSIHTQYTSHILFLACPFVFYLNFLSLVARRIRVFTEFTIFLKTLCVLGILMLYYYNSLKCLLCHYTLLITILSILLNYKLLQLLIMKWRNIIENWNQLFQMD
jgi:hypothetical protein